MLQLFMTKVKKERTPALLYWIATLSNWMAKGQYYASLKS